jgi:hypothetical protein
MSALKFFAFLIITTVLFSSCDRFDFFNNKEKLELEKEKLKLEQEKLELEKEKLNSKENSHSDENPNVEPKEKTPKSFIQPSVSSQESVINNFYRDFDNAFDPRSMREYIDKYYGPSLRPTYYKAELPSYNSYNAKQHSIENISLIGETSETRRYRVVFYFTFERTNGTSGSNKCADIITLDNNNMIIARNELGYVN